jgi:UPF0755 protein
MADDWRDPFAEDEAARERERRRLERRGRRVGGHGRSSDRFSATGELPWNRILLVGGAVAALALLVFGGAALISRLDGDDPAPAPVTRTVDVTIAEGHDRREVAALLDEQGFRGDYEELTESFPGFDPARYGAEDPANLEGFLFPDTYELRRPPSAKALVKRQLATFEERIKRVDLSYAGSKNLTTYDVLIIASMIEREAQVAEERRLVAAVIYNRLSLGMHLGIDATIRYEDGNFDEPLTQERLDTDTPYNTRTNLGLPPGPIGSPGLDSIEAAANPARTGYLYYVVKPDTCPAKHFFTDSEAEFQAAVARYNEAREAAGGQSPTC